MGCPKTGRKKGPGINMSIDYNQEAIFSIFCLFGSSHMSHLHISQARPPPNPNSSDSPTCSDSDPTGRSLHLLNALRFRGTASSRFEPHRARRTAARRTGARPRGEWHGGHSGGLVVHPSGPERRPQQRGWHHEER